MRILVGLGATTAALVMATTPATAGPAAPVAYKMLRSQGTGLCLQQNAGTTVGTGDCVSHSLRLWEYQRSAREGFLILRNQATGQCLDANRDGAVYMGSCDIHNVWQWWTPEPDGHIKHGGSGRYLDSNHERAVYTLPWNNGAYQRWS